MSEEQKDIEKFWAELDDSQKLERMHGVVKGLMRQLRELEARVIDFDHHDHLNGRMMLPASRGHNLVSEVGNTTGEWF